MELLGQSLIEREPLEEGGNSTVKNVFAYCLNIRTDWCVCVYETKRAAFRAVWDDGRMTGEELPSTVTGWH